MKNTRHYIDPRELSKICHEINTNYSKYKGHRYCVHPSYGLDNVAYLYYFINNGFDDYIFYSRIINRG